MAPLGINGMWIWGSSALATIDAPNDAAQSHGQ